MRPNMAPPSNVQLPIHHLPRVSGYLPQCPPIHPSLPQTHHVNYQPCMHRVNNYYPSDNNSPVSDYHQRNQRYQYHQGRSRYRLLQRNYRELNAIEESSQVYYPARKDEDDEDIRNDRYGRVSGRRISSVPLTGINLLVKRFLCFIACPMLRSSMRYGQDC